MPVVIYTTHPVIAPPSVLVTADKIICYLDGQCEMNGVEEKQKEKLKCLSYL